MGHREVRERFSLALALFDAAEAMLKQRLRRQTPSITEEELEQAVLDWRARRPGAESVDAEGVRISWPRRR